MPLTEEEMIRGMLQDIVLYLREFPDDEVVASDDKSRSLVGWVSYDPNGERPERTWRIHLNDLQRFLATDEGDHFRATLGSAQGRRDTSVTLRRIADRVKWNPEAAVKYLVSFVGDPKPPPPVSPQGPKNRFELMDEDN